MLLLLVMIILLFVVFCCVYFLNTMYITSDRTEGTTTNARFVLLRLKQLMISTNCFCTNFTFQYCQISTNEIKCLFTKCCIASAAFFIVTCFDYICRKWMIFYQLFFDKQTTYILKITVLAKTTRQQKSIVFLLIKTTIK